jgi:hypothetical protein
MQSLSNSLYLIFKKSIDSGVLPDIWKEANVTPLFKKVSKLKPSNYRPVSLTSIPCKILERLIAEFIMKHLLVNKLLSEEQHGFIIKCIGFKNRKFLLGIIKKKNFLMTNDLF